MLEVRGLGASKLGPLDLSLAAGELLCLTGASGTGKSLFLRALADLDPHEGSVRLDDLDQASCPAQDWRRRVGLLPASPSWWGDVVRDCFPPFPSGKTGKLPEGSDGDTYGLEELGLPPEVLTWEHERLSSGESQRLAFLRLLALRPALLLLDEPCANLDEANTLLIETLIHRYREEHDAACIVVSHDRAQQLRLGGRILRMEEGRLVE